MSRSQNPSSKGINIFDSSILAAHTLIEIMKQISIFTTVFVLLVLTACGVVRGQDFKTDVWLEDFAQLKREMSAQYANLEWAIENRGLDLKQLSEQTESRLLQARSEAEAKKIIESFLDAFGDGHLSKLPKFSGRLFGARMAVSNSVNRKPRSHAGAFH